MRKYSFVLSIAFFLSIVLGLNQVIADNKIEPASVEKMAFPLPDKPSFAILPFDNISKDPEQEYLSEGITDNLTYYLSKHLDLFVIAPGTTNIYKDKLVSVKDVAEELGVQYVIEGSVQGAEDHLRVTARMTDALKGYPVWSVDYDRNREDIFKIYEDILHKVAQSVGLKSPKLGPAPNLEGYLKYLQAMKYFQMQTIDSPQKAKPLFEEAIALDPNQSPFYLMLSFLYTDLARFYSSGIAREKNFEKGLELGKKAIELDKANDLAYVALGYSYMCQNNSELALSNFKQAYELNPLNVWAYSQTGSCLTYT